MRFRFPKAGLWPLFAVLNSFAGSADSPAEALLALKRPKVIAHRGFSAAAPENTLPAFRLAAVADADLTELDYHHTKDGELVVIHDDTLDRTTSATHVWGRTNLVVADFTMEQLRVLDAGSWHPTAATKTGLSTLAEAMDLIQRDGVTLIERKAGAASNCVELIRRKKLLNHVVVQAFDWKYLEDYRRLEPTQVLGGLGPWGSYRGEKLTDADKWLSKRWIDEAARIGFQAVVWNKQVRREAVDEAHRRGMQVWVYTINDPKLAGELLDLGVDGLISDNPAKLWKVLAERATH